MPKDSQDDLFQFLRIVIGTHFIRDLPNHLKHFFAQTLIPVLNILIILNEGEDPVDETPSPAFFRGQPLSIKGVGIGLGKPCGMEQGEVNSMSQQGLPGSFLALSKEEMRPQEADRGLEMPFSLERQ